MQIDHKPVAKAGRGAKIGLKVDSPVEEGDHVRLERVSTASLVGTIVQYYSRLGVAGLALSARLKVGQQIRICGQQTNFVQRVKSMELNRQRVSGANANNNVGILVDRPVEPDDLVLLVKERGIQRT